MNFSTAYLLGEINYLAHDGLYFVEFPQNATILQDILEGSIDDDDFPSNFNYKDVDYEYLLEVIRTDPYIVKQTIILSNHDDKL
jgi:hypothetical protein